MSCFQIPQPLNSDDDDDDFLPSSPTAAAKPDFSVFKQTIGRQFQNVASFLAPPPPQQQPSSSFSPPPLSHDSGEASPSSYEGIKSDLAEIGTSLKTGLSLLSPKKAVTEFSKFASNLLQSDKGDNDGFEEVSGINEDIVQFVKELSNRPKLWIDFPLSLQNKDFSMSSVQKDHALAIEQLVPSLTTLRHTVQNDMSEEWFWMIYFVLLLPRLNEDDYQLLLTPEIVLVHEEVLGKLRNKKNTPTGFSEDTPNKKGTERSTNMFQEIDASGETSNATYRRKNRNHGDVVSISDLDNETSSGVKSSMLFSPNEFSDWVRLSAASKAKRSTYHEGRSEKSDSSGETGNPTNGMNNKNHEEDVSSASSRLSSASETSDWVRLSETAKANRSTYPERRSESEESSEWHAVEDVDL